MGVTTAVAAQSITTVDGYQSSNDLTTAHSRLTVASIILWLGLIVLIALLVYYIYKSQKEASKWYLRLFLLLGLVLVFIAGVLASIASVNMDRATSSNISRTDARSLSNTTAVVGVVGGLVGIIGLIYTLVRSRRAKKAKAKSKAKED